MRACTSRVVECVSSQKSERTIVEGNGSEGDGAGIGGVDGDDDGFVD